MQRDAKGRVVDVGIAADDDDVELVPAARLRLGEVGREVRLGAWAAWRAMGLLAHFFFLQLDQTIHTGAALHLSSLAYVSKACRPRRSVRAGLIPADPLNVPARRSLLSLASARMNENFPAARGNLIFTPVGRSPRSPATAPVLRPLAQTTGADPRAAARHSFPARLGPSAAPLGIRNAPSRSPIGDAETLEACSAAGTAARPTRPSRAR